MAWSFVADLDGDIAGAFETDWTSYLMAASIKRGRAHPLASIEAGTATFTLNNADGRFSPFKGTISGLDHFKRVQFSDTDNLFTGFISDFSFEPGASEKRAFIEAVDILGLAGGIKINMDIIDGRTSDLSLHRVIDLVQRGNVISNPGAKIDLTNWSAILDTETVTRDTTPGVALEEPACVKCVTPGGATGEGVEYDAYADNWVDAELAKWGGVFVNAPNGATMRFIIYTQDGYQASGYTLFTGTGSWQHITALLYRTMAGETTALKVRIETYSTAQAITFYVDGLNAPPYANRIIRSCQAGLTSLYRVSFSDESGLEAIRKIIESEPGFFWVDGSGTIQFKNKDYAPTLEMIFSDDLNTITFEIAASGDDGHLVKISAVSYADARAATAAVSTVDPIGLGQYFAAGPIYWIRRVYLRFSTENIPDAATVTSAILRLYLTGDNTVTDYTIQVRKKAWGATLEAADWSATPSGDTLLGTFATASFPAINNWVEIPLTASEVPKGAGEYLEIYLISNLDDDDPGTEPTTNEMCAFESLDDMGGHAPQLVVAGIAIAKSYQSLRPNFSKDDRVSKVIVNCAAAQEVSDTTNIIWRYGGAEQVILPLRDDSGTSTSIGEVSTSYPWRNYVYLSDSSKSWTENEWYGATVEVLEGGHSHSFTVLSNTTYQVKGNNWYPHEPTADVLAYTITLNGYKQIYAAFSAPCSTPTITVQPPQADCTATWASVTDQSGTILLTNLGAVNWTITELYVEGYPVTVISGGGEAIFEYDELLGVNQWIDRELSLDMLFDLETSDIVKDTAIAKGSKYTGMVVRTAIGILANTDAYWGELRDLDIRDQVRLIDSTLAYSLGIDKNCYIEGIDLDLEDAGLKRIVTLHVEEV